MEQQRLQAEVTANLKAAEEFLCSLIAIPSLPGEEHEVMCFAEEEFMEDLWKGGKSLFEFVACSLCRVGGFG